MNCKNLEDLSNLVTHRICGWVKAHSDKKPSLDSKNVTEASLARLLNRYRRTGSYFTKSATKTASELRAAKVIGDLYGRK